MLLPVFGEVLEEAAIQQRVEKVSAIEGDPVATKAAKIWSEALETSKAADASTAAEKELRTEIEQLDSLKALEMPKVPEGELQLAEEEALLEKIRGLIQASEERRKEIVEEAQKSPDQIASLIEEATEIRTALNDLMVPALAPGELEAAQHQKAVQEKRRLNARLEEIAAKQDLLRRESALFTERVARRKDHIKKLEDLATQLAASIADHKEKENLKNKEAVDALGDDLSGVPELSRILGEIRGYRERKKALEEDLSEAKAYGESVVEVRRKIEEQFESAESRIKLLEDAGLEIDDDTGVLLRRQRANLPSVDEISAKLQEKLERAARAELSLMSLSDVINGVPPLSDVQIKKIREENPKIPEAKIEELLEQRANILKGVDGTLRKLKEELTKGTEVAKSTISEIKEYSGFIDERLLWIKSTRPLHWMEPVAEWGRVIRLFGADHLGLALQSVRENFVAEIARVVFVLLVLLGVAWRRRRLRAVLEKSSQLAVRRNCTSLLPTLKFLGASVLLSLWIPLPLWCVSEMMEAPVPWKVALLRLALFLFLGSLFLKFTRPQGLFVSHFKMAPERAALLNKNLRWMTLVAPAFVFLVPALTLSWENTDAGRVVFILAMLMVACFLHHLFRPGRLSGEGEESPGAWEKFIYLFVMSIPLVFVIGAGLGYFASVLTLRDQVGATGGLLIMAYLVIRFLTRWTLVSRRGLAISQALKRREAVVAHREMEAEGQARNEEVPSLEEVKAEAVNVVEVEEQTTQLLRLATYIAVFFGLWVIWSSTLPALKVLDEVTLWGAGQPAAEQQSSAPPVPGVSALTGQGEEATPKDKVRNFIPADDGEVTLQDLLLSIIFFALTFIAARNIPGLLSLTLFSRINLGPGGNFALTTTVRYLIVLIGIVIALAQIEITWGKVQWLAAAVSLGIGFGLQEIFANFVAGIILLFERPIRLGDIVTVGDISGKVTQIKIRATTIQQFNNRELLVPNKEFITSQLVNWTLKDSVLRFEIPVGIAYGSDTEKANRILGEIIEGHEKVLSDPAPSVLFSGFGNSTLDFIVRGFVAVVDDLVPTQSELHFRIDNAFREAEIEIAFPQQDIHLRSLPEGMEIVKKS